MKKIQIKNFSPEATEIYKKFKEQVGSEHTASLPAIQVVFNILKKKPKTILEFGGGIGTLSYLCLKYSDAEIDIYENNDFCIKALGENLNEFEGRYALLTDDNFYLSHKSYDLVIVDDNPYQYFRDIVKNTENIKEIFFEGRRFSAQDIFRKALKRKYSFKYIRYYHEKNEKKCGYGIICFKNKSPLLNIWNNWIYFLEYVRTRGWEGVKEYTKKIIKKLKLKLIHRYEKNPN